MSTSIIYDSTCLPAVSGRVPIAWRIMKAVPSMEWKLLPVLTTTTTDANAGRIWALCLPRDPADYVTVKGISFPLTHSEEVASPRKPKSPRNENLTKPSISYWWITLASLPLKDHSELFWFGSKMRESWRKAISLKMSKHDETDFDSE